MILLSKSLFVLLSLPNVFLYNFFLFLFIKSRSILSPLFVISALILSNLSSTNAYIQKYYKQLIFICFYSFQILPSSQIASSLRKLLSIIFRFSQAFLNSFSNYAIWFLIEIPKWIASFPLFFIIKG